MASASFGARTGYSIGRVLCKPSTDKAAARETPNVFQRFHSGFHASTASISMNVAKASLSHSPFHHDIVTRSPNHMCAFSCATTSATRSSSPCVALCGSTSKAVSRKVMAPRFSMAPEAKSGMARRSSLSPG